MAKLEMQCSESMRSLEESQSHLTRHSLGHLLSLDLSGAMLEAEYSTSLLRDRDRSSVPYRRSL